MVAINRRDEGRRLALIIATSTYEDFDLRKLRAPGRDAEKLAGVLGNAAIGNFEVETVVDAPVDVLRRRIAQFCGASGPSDLALIYFSCHGVLDDRGRLYYAAVDTDRSLLSVTALQAAWLNEQMEDSRCRRQVLLLDCCHSGAFAKAKGGPSLALRQEFESRGRAVLTASRATEYSFESDEIVADAPGSVFTEAVVEGLTTGQADRDGDGMVTVAELYEYTHQAVLEHGASQTPSLWTYGAEGTLLVALNPRGGQLPNELKLAINSPWPSVREGAVSVLAELLRSHAPGLADSARRELAHMAERDTASLAEAARRALEGSPASTTVPPTPTTVPAKKLASAAADDTDSLRRRWRPTRLAAVATAAILGMSAIVAVLVALSDGTEGTTGNPAASRATAVPAVAGGQQVLGPPRLSAVKPSCPSDPCYSVSRTTAITTKAGGLGDPMRVPRNGDVVSWAVKQSRPSAGQIAFFNKTVGGDPRAGIAVLRRSSGHRYTLIDAAPVKGLKAYFGRVATFRLERPLAVRKDDVVALSVPTWVAAMRVDRSNDSSWRSSREPGACTRTSRQSAQLELGSSATYACSYNVAFIAYTATVK